ncbi:hypothetical protein [Mycobacterium sp. CnD-18-1]|uniref:hypothetical protein n=1 Tax=Mycobacterium sp. CnD-18-1 TaxID=2917744 RepID=UPI001EF16E58|nr:hypothetical protein [Mycobacterium sp. CnD-18-1]MCG7607081.1 hypothetical protein [Mycobacterium sp. CnD-18-1]
MTSPFNPGADNEVLRWLTRESFEKRITDLGMQIIEYTETEVETVSKEAREFYPDATWVRFEAVAKYSDEIEALLNERYGVPVGPELGGKA